MYEFVLQALATIETCRVCAKNDSNQLWLHSASHPIHVSSRILQMCGRTIQKQSHNAWHLGCFHSKQKKATLLTINYMTMNKTITAVSIGK